MKLLDQPQPPTCLHILGQGLVNALWYEGRELKVHAPLIEALQGLNNVYNKGIITELEFQARSMELVQEHFYQLKSKS